jgi:hypothetical protein
MHEQQPAKGDVRRLEIHDPRERRFLDDLVAWYGNPTVRQNHEAYALFEAMQRAFCAANHTEGPVGDPYLVAHLAACAWVALEYDRGAWIPWDSERRDFVICRALRGLMKTVATAIRQGSVRADEAGEYSLQACQIPAWFVVEEEEAAREEQEWHRQWRWPEAE